MTNIKRHKSKSSKEQVRVYILVARWLHLLIEVRVLKNEYIPRKLAPFSLVMPKIQVNSIPYQLAE